MQRLANRDNHLGLQGRRTFKLLVPTFVSYSRAVGRCLGYRVSGAKFDLCVLLGQQTPLTAPRRQATQIAVPKNKSL